MLLTKCFFLFSHHLYCRRTNDDRDIFRWSIQPKFLQQEQPIILITQLDIQNDEIRMKRFYISKLLICSHGEGHPIPFVFKQHTIKFEKGLVIINNKNTRRHSSPLLSSDTLFQYLRYSSPHTCCYRNGALSTHGLSKTHLYANCTLYRLRCHVPKEVKRLILRGGTLTQVALETWLV